MSTNLIMILAMLIAIGGLGFMLSLSIKKHDKKMAASKKKKKGRSKYMPQAKTPGR